MIINTYWETFRKYANDVKQKHGISLATTHKVKQLTKNIYQKIRCAMQEWNEQRTYEHHDGKTRRPYFVECLAKTNEFRKL